jgi:hypothetical protein
MLRLLAIIIIALLVISGCKVEPLKITRTRTSSVDSLTFKYMVEKVAGWDVYVEDTLWLERPKLTMQVLVLLQECLSDVVNSLPKDAVDQLRTVKIYVTTNDAAYYLAAFHRSPHYLRGVGLDPGMTKSIELPHPSDFVEFIHRKPWIMMHELTHAYDDLFLTEDEQFLLTKLYRAAMDEFKYQNVATVHTRGVVEHYAASNEHEYFAEASEAYWGRNDYYPFDRDDLLSYDPAMYHFLSKVWTRPAK